jgi:hypothetical protein
MAEPTRYSTSAVELPDRTEELEPTPVPGCLGCAELDKVRGWARESRDQTTITDANVLMRRHPEGH